MNFLSELLGMKVVLLLEQRVFTGETGGGRCHDGDVGVTPSWMK